MADVREKLIEILRVPIFSHLDADPAEVVADYLLDNGVTVQKWIPVTERLPKEDCEVVLVFGKRGGIYTAEFRRKGEYTWFHKLNSKCHHCEPTHWMPLPEPPKEDV